MALTESEGLDRIEVDRDLANLLRRFASREGLGVSEVLQRALVSYARSRLWDFVQTDAPIIESVDEEVRLFLMAIPPEVLRADRTRLLWELGRRYGPPPAGPRGLIVRLLRRALERLEARQ